MFATPGNGSSKGQPTKTRCRERDTDAEAVRDQARRKTAARVRAISETSLRPKPACPAEVVLEALKGRWTIHILKSIADRGALHFGAVKRAIPGISSKVLTKQLRHLEQSSILHRQPKPAVRLEMLYSLTNRGQELKAVLDHLTQLGARWQHEDASRWQRGDSEQGRPDRRCTTISCCGVAPDEVIE